MEAEHVFYALAAVFATSAVLYFTWEYLLELSDTVKLICLACLTIAFFFGAMILHEKQL